VKRAIERYFYVTLDAVGAFIAYHFFGWVGFGCWALFTLLFILNQIHEAMTTTMTTLLSRLPDRCAMCHREIVDEGGTVAKGLEGETRIYHEECSNKLESIRQQVLTSTQ